MSHHNPSTTPPEKPRGHIPSVLPPSAYLAKGQRHAHTAPESLLTHTRHVLLRIAQLRDRQPDLADIAGDPRLWHRLGLAAALHDLGKTDPRFQQMLTEDRDTQRKSSAYGHRHEILSLAWLNWALGDDPHQDRFWIAAPIASHHRDSSFIFERYNLGTVFRPTTYLADFLAPLPDDLFSQAADYFLMHLLPELQALELLATDWTPPPPWIATPEDKFHAESSIHTLLRLWETWMQDSQPIDVRRLGTFTRGLIMLADHAGSAHADFRSVPLLQDTVATAHRFRPPKQKTYYPHQEAAATRTGHALLIAPTGSGKTEAALRWAACQYAQGTGHPPLFYVLPFKASMNAMQQRLADKVTPPQEGDQPQPELVALQHSSALQVLYHQLMHEPTDAERSQQPSSAQAEWLAKRQQNLAKLHTTPIRVLSPYQLLRAAYQLNGHEAIWTDAAGGLFIFDEIHAYEAPRLARILEMLRFLIEHFGARAFVMTATMPPPVKHYLLEIFGHPELITAANHTYEEFRRHRLKLCETGLLDDATISQIVTRIQAGEAVLCVATTVKRAQELQQKLQEQLGDSANVKLLHSRFTGRDRNALEKEIREAVATNAEASQRRPIALVATQVVEVSLDVDFDVLFSDPAPIEALLQRFGRVNRSRRPDPKDVIVCTVLDDAKPVYEDRESGLGITLVERGLDALRTADHSLIDESLVQQWIDQVYAGPIGERFLKQLRQSASEFRAAVLSNLKPFDTNSELEDLFYQQFDGAEVLPKSLANEYRTLMDTEPLAATMLTVPVSHAQLKRLFGQKRIVPAAALGLPPSTPPIVDVSYTPTTGLRLDQPNDVEST